MDSQAISEIIKRESSVISSEESLERSLCVENEFELRQKKRNFKSSSLNCLPNLDHFLDFPTATLPAKLSSVKPFTEDLSAGLSVNTCYETAESSCSTLAEYKSSEEDDIHIVDNDNPCQDQRSSHKLQNTASGGKRLNGSAEKYKVKQDIDLSQINTETQTFVRMSALDILAAFPETETVLSGEQTAHRSKSPKMLGGQTKLLNPVSEDGCNGEDSALSEHVQSCPVKSEQVPDGGSTPEIISWSSSGDVDKRQKKKRLFHKKKKHFYEISRDSDIQASNEGPLDNKEDFVKDKTDPETASKETAKTKKRKQSSGLMNFFRGKSEIKEDSPKQEKTKKDRKPLSKSQSFHSGISNSPTKSTQQLNRMDSFKKIFKRQRDSAVTSPTDAKDNEQFKCLEISSPILKTEYRSTNLVDREVILRNRAFQSDETRLQPDKNKDERGISNGSEVIINDPALNHHENRLVNGSGATKQSPVAPVRWKHLERKRLSTSFEEGNVLKNYFTEGLPDIEKEARESGIHLNTPNGDTKWKENDDIELNGSVVNVLECEASPKVKTDGDFNTHSNVQNEETIKQEVASVELNCGTTDMLFCEGLSKRHSNTHSDNSNGDTSCKNNAGMKVINCTADVKTSQTLDIGNEDPNTHLDTPNGDDDTGFQLNDRITDTVVHGLSDHSESADSTVQRSPVLDDNDNREGYVILEHAPKEVDESYTVIIDLAPVCEQSLPCQSPFGLDDTSGLEDDNEVFEDCTDGRNVSFHSSNVVVDGRGMPTASDAGTSKGSDRRKYNSDVSSVKSKHAIETAKTKKKPISVSFSAGKSSSDTPGSSLSMSTSSSIERLPSEKKGRSMSIFAKSPTAKLEQSEPPTLVTDLVPTSFPMMSTDRRSQIVLELFTTERTYVRGLETMIELFKKPLAGKMDENTINTLFSNIHDIFAVNKDLLFLLWEKLKHWGNEQCIGQIFVDMEERFKLYAVYCKNFDKSDAVFKKKMRKDKEFDRFLKTCYQDPLCQPGLDLPAYLITIVQRIPRYLLLLKDLSKKTLPSHPDYDNLKQALSRVMKVAEYINSQLQEVHGKKAMQELRSTVIGLEAYEVKGRTLLKEAEVCLMSPKKPYKCLLFNDVMVFAVQGSKDRSEIEMTLELKTLWFEDLKKTDPQTNKCDAIELFTPHRPYTMYACSRTDKRVWLQKLRTAIVNLLYGADCEDPDAMDISRRKASDTYIDGSVYCGEYQNGKRHGHGVMAWPNRTRYEGCWADDERHGQGQLTYYTGEKYVGNWVADKKDGEGKQTYVNGDVYCGEWSEGKMHRKGVIDFANGDRFVGEMANNEVEGNGEMTCVSGLVYKGEWKNSKRHGQGHLFSPNGNEYKGEMLNDRICGYGKMTYFNGDEYTGEWVNEMRHGIGYFKVVQGAVYDGQWNNDFMNGQGKMSYPNGDQYTGTWHRNKRFGKGQLMYAHGDTYNGQWEDDVMHGKGVMYYKDGSVYEGAWERGERHGYGKTVYCDKRLYEGEYLSGFRHGRGKLIYSNNVCYVGEWKSDKFDGNGVFSDPNTEYSYQGDWCCGKREGAGVEIYYKTRYEGNWKADMKHGNGIEKSHAGHIFEGTWKENKKHGKGVRILRSKVREEQQWHEGHLIDIVGTVAEDLPSLPRR